MSRERVVSIDLPTDGPQDVTVSAVHASMDVLSQHVRRIYVLSYREHQNTPDYGKEPIPDWDGGETQWGTHRTSVWPRIAKHIVTIGVDPLDYIRAQFWAAKANKPPTPTYLLSSAAGDRYRSFQAGAVQRAIEAFQADALSVQRSYTASMTGLHWDYRRAVEYALYNVNDVRASALFRHCMAASLNLPAVAEYFRDTAVLQYVFQREVYDAAWGSNIPTTVRLAGAELHARITGR